MSEAQRLVREAERIVEESLGESGIQAELARELALVLEHLKRLKSHHKNQCEYILEDECTLGTQLLQHPDEELKLRPLLLALSAEKRRLTATFEEHRVAAEEKLFDLVRNARMLRPPGDD